VLEKKTLIGDCEWILPFVGGPRIRQLREEIQISLRLKEAGNWIGIAMVRAPRVHFHATPNSSSVQKAYAVAGDVVYIYDEQSGWRLVQFQGRRGVAEGWMRKADTLSVRESMRFLATNKVLD
jgi:hypothetical protein